MKKLIEVVFVPLIVVLCLASQIQAQTYFEGIISYKLSASGSGADAKTNSVAASLPQFQEYQFSGADVKLKVTGGINSGMKEPYGELYIDASNSYYLIAPDAKSAHKVPIDEDDKQANDQVITKMGEALKILGYTCNKYKLVKKGEDGKSIVSYLWITNEIKLKKYKVPIADQISIFSGEVSGVILKSMTKKEGVTFVMTAQKVESKKLNRNVFKLPADYDITEYDNE